MDEELAIISLNIVYCRVCYERKGVPAELQFSDPPRVDDPNVLWGIPGDLFLDEPIRFLPFNSSLPSGRPIASPNGDCPNRCASIVLLVIHHVNYLQAFMKLDLGSLEGIFIIYIYLLSFISCLICGGTPIRLYLVLRIILDKYPS